MKGSKEGRQEGEKGRWEEGMDKDAGRKGERQKKKDSLTEQRESLHKERCNQQREDTDEASWRA